MTSFFEKLDKAKNGIYLDEARKNAVRNRLIQEMNIPVREESFARQNMQRSYSQLFVSFLLKPMPIPVIAILVATFLSGGVSYAAQNSLPGDVLYPVKVNINEEVRSALTFSPEARAVLDTQRAERRLSEAAELAAKGKMNAEARAIIEANFKEHADRVEARVKELNENGKAEAAADIASNLETSLRAHGKVLERLEEKSEEKTEIRALEEKVKVRLDKAVKSRTEIEEKIKNENEDKRPERQTTAERKIKAAGNFIESAQNFLENRKEKLGAEATAQAEARLKSALDMLAKAQANLEAKAYGEAFLQAGDSMRIAKEAKALIEIQTHLKARGASIEIEINGEVKSDIATTSEDNDDDEDDDKVR